jgi:hypothetical protein
MKGESLLEDTGGANRGRESYDQTAREQQPEKILI